MKLSTLLIVLIGIECIFFSRCKGQTYYVKAREDADCPNQPCEILEDYLDTTLSNGLTTIRAQYITLVFLNGTHSIRSAHNNYNITIHIFRSVLNIVGEKNHNVIVEIPENDETQYSLLFILQGSRLYIENLNLLPAIPMGVYDCSSLYTQFCDCSESLFPDFDDCGGTLQVSSVNSIMTIFSIGISQQAHFINCIFHHSFIFFRRTEYAVLCNTTLFDGSRIFAITSMVTFINSSSFTDSEVVAMSSRIELSQKNIFANISSSAIKCYKTNIMVN